MNSSAEDRPQSLRVVTGMMLAVMIVNSMDRTVLSVLVDDVKRDLLLDDRQLGLLLGPAFTICYLVASFPLASLADRGYRRNVIAAGLMAWSVLTMLTATATGFVGLFLLRMGVGLGEASASSPGQSLIVARAPADQRTRSLSVIATGSVIGLAIGMVVGGWASDRWDWRTAFLIAGAPGVLLSIVFFAVIREPAAPARSASSREALVHLLRIPTFRWVVAGQSAALLASVGRSLWEPSFLRRIYDMSASEAGLIYFLSSPVPMVLGIYCGSRLVDHFSQRDVRWRMWVPALSQVGSVPFLLLFLLWPADDRFGSSLVEGGVPFALVWSVIASAIGGAYAAPMLSTVQEVAPEAMRSRAAALANALSMLVGAGLGPYLVGEMNHRFEPIYGHEAIRYSLVALATVALLGASCWWGASRRIRDALPNAS